MIYPIQIEELLERVSGNREFVIQMLSLFFQTCDERLSSLRKQFDNRNYQELAYHSHKLKGLAGNLSISKALPILAELHNEAESMNDVRIGSLLNDLEKTMTEARIYFDENPTLMH